MTAALIWRQCTAQISQLNKSSNKEHCICKAVHGVFASGAAFCLPCKGRWVAEGNSEGFCRVIWNLNRMSVTFNPSVRSWTRVQLPLQGSLLNPSVYSLRSQTAPDGSLSPLLLRDISPHRGESPFTRESIKSLSLFADSRPAPDGRESPLSLRDISPHRGESPFTREPFRGGGENQISVPPTGRM